MNIPKSDKDFNQFNWCEKYVKYLDLYEKGLRKKSLVILKEFYNDFKAQDKIVRRDFVDYVLKLVFFNKKYSLYLPQSFYKEIIVPEINAWIVEEPNNPIPYKWSYEMDKMKISLKLDPHDSIALDLLGTMIINKISMNQHEVASGFSYNGNPKEDIDLINYYESFLDNIKEPEKKETVRKILVGLKECALNNLSG